MNNKNHTKAIQLIDAIKNGDTSSLKQILTSKIDLNDTALFSFDFLPLLVACEYLQPEIAKLLIKSGADVNVSDHNKRSALDIACEHYNADSSKVAKLTKILLEAGASTKWKNSDKDRAIHYAAMYGYAQALEFLLETGVSPDLRGEYGRRALHYVVCRKNAVELIDILLKFKAKTYLKNKGKQTALAEAILCENPNIEAIKKLINLQKKLDKIIDPYLGTVLHCAAAGGLTQIIEFIADKIDMNIKNNTSQTALDIAMEWNKPEAAILLYTKGTRSKSNYFTNIFSFAISNNKHKFLKKLLQKEFDKNEAFDGLLRACYIGNLRAVKILTDTGVPIKNEKYKEYALIQSAKYGHLQIVKYLIEEKEADINVQNGTGDTALILACRKGYIEIVKYLLQKKADLNIKNINGRNALIEAVDKNKYEIAELLLNKGIDANIIEEEWGYTAMDLALRKQNETMIELLKRFNVKKRKISIPAKDAAYHSIIECDICAFLPNKRTLDDTEYPRFFPNLDIVITDYEQAERYTNISHEIMRCPVCGVYYYLYHSIDTEDAFVGGPDISHEFMRLNIELTKELLKKQKKTKEIRELERISKPMIKAFEKTITENKNIKPNLLPFVVETLVDYYIVENHPDKLKQLFSHKNKDIKKWSKKSFYPIGKISHIDDFPYFRENRNISRKVKSKFSEIKLLL